MTIDDKRRAVYASLIRFAPEAMPLRDRALRQLVLGALLGSSVVEPFRIGRIRTHLSFGADLGGVRTEVIQAALDRLMAEGRVGHSLLRDRHAYYLTEDGDREIAAALVTSEELIEAVLKSLLQDTPDLVPKDVAAAAFKRFVFECFARFGRTIARQVTGTMSPQDLVRAVDVRAAFAAAVAPHALSPDQCQSLEARFTAFLRSSAALDQRLKFFLTQGYYFAQLVGIADAEFNPIAEEAFADAVLYIDTNVLLTGVLAGEEAAEDFLEVLSLASRIGIELRVSRATLNELLRVTNDRIPDLERIVAVLPTELAEKTNDQILAAFLRKRAEIPDFSPQQFIEPVTALLETITKDWPISLDERTEADMFGGRDVSEIVTVLDEEAEKSRGWGKSPKVAEHDAAHLLAVSDLRIEGRRAWFLTRDQSFAGVAERLQPEQPPFYFSHLGFLQSISPFLTSPSEERSFAEVFSAFMSDQVRPIESLFDMRELALMAEFHEDVMATPPDQLVMAFDYVKNRTLDGRPYRPQDMPKVSLDLRKFLSADKDEQLRALQEERQRVADEARRERDLRSIAETERDTEARRRGELEDEMDDLKAAMSLLRSEHAQDRQAFEEYRDAQARAAAKRRAGWQGVFAMAGAVLGLSLWYAIGGLLTRLRGAGLGEYGVTGAEIFVTVVAAVAFLIPSLLFLRERRWSREVKSVLLTALVATALGVGNVIGSEALSAWADRIGIATLLAVGLGSMVLPAPDQDG